MHGHYCEKTIPNCHDWTMDELLSRFPDITEDIFESLDDESLVCCKEANRSLSFMDEDTKLESTKLIINTKNWKSLMDLKKKRPEMHREPVV